MIGCTNSGTASWVMGESLEQLHQAQAWTAYGYQSWATFCTGELGISASTASRHRNAYLTAHEGPLRSVRAAI